MPNMMDALNARKTARPYMQGATHLPDPRAQATQSALGTMSGALSGLIGVPNEDYLARKEARQMSMQDVLQGGGTPQEAYAAMTANEGFRDFFENEGPMMMGAGTIMKVPDRLKTGWTFKDVGDPRFTRQQSKKVSDELSVPRYQEAELPIRSMKATQESVNPNFAESASRKTEGQLPTVVKSGGEYYVRDGHHRLVAEASKGKQTAKVALVDLDKTDKTAPLLDWKPRGVSTAEDQAILDALFKDMSGGNL